MKDSLVSGAMQSTVRASKVLGNLGSCIVGFRCEMVMTDGHAPARVCLWCQNPCVADCRCRVADKLIVSDGCDKGRSSPILSSHLDVRAVH